MSCKQCAHLNDISDLSAPYVIRTSLSCGRKIYLRELGESGHGIKIEKGDQFILPADFLKISANPLKSTGSLSRAGLEWFAKLIFIEELEKNHDNLTAQLQKNDEYCDSILKNSELLENLDIENPDHGDLIVQRLSSYKDSLEWWVLLFSVFNLSSSEMRSRATILSRFFSMVANPLSNADSDTSIN